MEVKNDDGKKPSKLEKSYFDVLGICCSSEASIIDKILKPLEGVHDVSVIVPSRTVIVLHDPLLISQLQIVKVLNQARFEANVRVKVEPKYRQKYPSPVAVACGVLLLLSFLKYAYHPLKWLALGAVAVGIGPIILKGFAAIRNFKIDINILMLIAVVGSIALKDYWEAGTIVFLFTIAQWLDSRASHEATAVMSSLMNIAPQRAILAETGEEVDAGEVKLNTILAVKAGEIIPIDGIVVEGKCEVDEKTLTGESFPVAKQIESSVWAGTINLNGYISVKTTALAEDCVVARMAKLVEEAQNNKSKTQRFIDKCAIYYTPGVVIVSALIAIIPAALRVHNQNKWFHLALVVMVCGCPCALILSTPIATFCALSKAATTGLLVKGAEYLETLAKVRIIAFDKTGTISRGEFLVTDFRSLMEGVSLEGLLYWVSSIESKSSHPMAAALIDYAHTHSIEPKPDNVEELQNFPGEGIYGKIDGKDIYIGNRKIATRAGCTAVPTLQGDTNEGKSTGYIFLGSSVAGIFSLTDMCRTGVAEALKELKSMGIKTAMLTGDCQAAAIHAQDQLGGALDEVHFELLPEDKARIINEFQKEFPTAMVGDGLNDAPALATADIGISMGVSGSALATETGHVILLSNDIRKVPKAVRLARRTRRKIIENVILSIVTKAGILALAIAGHPLVWAAVLADVGTCLLVIFNSMLLLRGTRGYRGTPPSSSQARNQSCCKPNNDQCCSSVSKGNVKYEPEKCSSKTCASLDCESNKKYADLENQYRCCESGPFIAALQGNDKCSDSESKPGCCNSGSSPLISAPSHGNKKGLDLEKKPSCCSSGLSIATPSCGNNMSSDSNNKSGCCEPHSSASASCCKPATLIPTSSVENNNCSDSGNKNDCCKPATFIPTSSGENNKCSDSGNKNGCCKPTTLIPTSNVEIKKCSNSGNKNSCCKPATLIPEPYVENNKCSDSGNKNVCCKPATLIPTSNVEISKWSDSPNKNGCCKPATLIPEPSVANNKCSDSGKGCCKPKALIPASSDSVENKKCSDSGNKNDCCKPAPLFPASNVETNKCSDSGNKNSCCKPKPATQCSNSNSEKKLGCCESGPLMISETGKKQGCCADAEQEKEVHMGTSEKREANAGASCKKECCGKNTSKLALIGPGGDLSEIVIE